MDIDKFQIIANKIFGGIMPRAKKATAKQKVVEEKIVKEGQVGRLVVDTLSIMTNSFKQSLVADDTVNKDELRKIFSILESHEVSTRNKALDQVSSLFKK